MGRYYFCVLPLYLHGTVCGNNLLKQDGDSPKPRQTDYGKDNAAENTVGAAKQKANQVKLKQSDQQPVNSADNYKCKRYLIHVFLLLLIALYKKQCFFNTKSTLFYHSLQKKKVIIHIFSLFQLMHYAIMKKN